MGEKLDPRETVSFGEALRMEMIINQALIDIFVVKVKNSNIFLTYELSLDGFFVYKVKPTV